MIKTAINCLLSLDIFKVKSEDIFDVRQKNIIHPDRVWEILPKFCLNAQTGCIVRSEYYLQFIGKFEAERESEYIMFNVAFADAHLQEEIFNSGLEDAFKEVDFREYFKNLLLREWKDAYRQLKNSTHFIVELTYHTSYSYEYGIEELDDISFIVKGVLKL